MKLAAVLLLTAACLAWVLWGLDFQQVGEALSHANWAWILPSLLIYLATHSVRSWRLQVLLGDQEPRPSFPAVFNVISIGFLAINVVPLRLGELVRPYLLKERHGVAWGRSMAAIVMERLLDLSMLLILLLWMSLLVDLPSQGIRVGDVDVVAGGQRLLGTAVALGVAGLATVAAIGQPAVTLLERVSPRISAFARAFVHGIRNLGVSRGVKVVGASAFIWGGTIAAVWGVMLGFPGLPATWEAALTTWTVTITGMTVAPTPGFFGAYEAFCVAALGLWSVPRELAATFAVVLHLSQFGFIVGLGGVMLVREGLSLGALVKASREAQGD